MSPGANASQPMGEQPCSVRVWMPAYGPRGVFRPPGICAVSPLPVVPPFNQG